MVNDALAFMLETSRPSTHHEARVKIAMLAKEIQDTYKAHIRRSTGKTCDICGAGDTDERCRVHDLIHGYEHREYLSPVLCFNHYCGWRLSYSSLVRLRNRMKVITTVFDEPVLSDEEIDLHFTQFLANQLLKAARRTT